MAKKKISNKRNFRVEIEPLMCTQMVNVPIIDEKTNELIGRILLADMNNKLVTPSELFMVDIYIINEKDRRKGVAYNALKGLIEKTPCPVITDGVTEAGKKLCLKCGFKYVDRKKSNLMIRHKTSEEFDKLFGGKGGYGNALN